MQNQVANLLGRVVENLLPFLMIVELEAFTRRSLLTYRKLQFRLNSLNIDTQLVILHPLMLREYNFYYFDSSHAILTYSMFSIPLLLQRGSITASNGSIV